MPNAGTQTKKKEAIACPNVYDKGEGKCVVCGHTCSFMERDDGLTSNCEPVCIRVCSPHCLVQLDQNHRNAYGLPDPNQMIKTPMHDEDVTNWRIDNGNGVVFMENGKMFIFLTAYYDQGHEYIPHVCIELSELLRILANQGQ